MQKTGGAIKIVNLASMEAEESVIDSMRQLGEPFSVVNSKSWLENLLIEPCSKILLVLPGTNVKTDKIVTAILETRSYIILLFSFPL